MTGKQSTGKQGRALGERLRRDTIFFSTEVLEWGIHACIRLLLAAVLSGVVLPGERAPLGVAMTAASGAGVLGGGAVLGACVGSLCQLELTDGLRYASAALLTYAAAFAFYDIRPLRKAWTMPLTAGIAVAFTGLVSHSRQNWTWEEQGWLLLEIGIAVGAVWCFRAAMQTPGLLTAREEPGRMRRYGLAVLFAALLAALEPLELLGMSAGRVLGSVSIIRAAWLGGASVGTVWGTVLGLCMDLAGDGAPVRVILFPAAGLAAGLWSGGPRVRTALPWSLAACAVALWLGDWDSGAVCAAESVTSALIFLALPSKVLKRGRYFLPASGGEVEDPDGVRGARERLRKAAEAYGNLCHTLKDSLRPPENDGDISVIFDRTAERVCKGCANRAACWGRDYGLIFGAFNDATPAILERGRALGEDFPPFFAHRCIHLPDFISAVNEELTALFYRRQYLARIRESREAVCSQYDRLAALLYETARELGGELLADPDSLRAVRRWVGRRGLHVGSAAFRDSRGLLRVRFEGADACHCVGPQAVAELSESVGRPLRTEQEGDDWAALVEQEPFKALAGVASRKKDGETVSGDAGTWFKRPDGKVCFLLCDGMGSGEAANRESGLAVRLLEQFILAGIPADHALHTLTDALALRGEVTGGFTTVDLLEVDLFTGEGHLYKLGAAPTYVRQGESLRRLAGEALPAGLARGGEETADRFELRLAPGDWVVMVSDGVCASEEDGWLLEQLRDFEGDSPRKLASRLITQSPGGATDDCTALAVRLEKRIS